MFRVNLEYFTLTINSIFYQATPVKTDVAEDFPVAIDTIKTGRTMINDGWKQLLYAKEQGEHIVATGKAHTECKFFLRKN